MRHAPEIFRASGCRGQIGPAIRWWWPIWKPAITAVTIVAGNERVLRARRRMPVLLGSGSQDRPHSRLPHAPSSSTTNLGSGAARSRAVDKLAIGNPGPVICAAPISPPRHPCRQACQCSTFYRMVWSSSQLQGIVVRYYAIDSGRTPAVPTLSAEHYRASGPHERCPSAPGSVSWPWPIIIDTLVASGPSRKIPRRANPFAAGAGGRRHPLVRGNGPSPAVSIAADGTSLLPLILN